MFWGSWKVLEFFVSKGVRTLNKFSCFNVIVVWSGDNLVILSAFLYIGECA